MLSPGDHVLEYVDAYLHDALARREARYVEQHCESCRICQVALYAAPGVPRARIIARWVVIELKLGTPEIALTCDGHGYSICVVSIPSRIRACQQRIPRCGSNQCHLAADLLPGFWATCE